MFISRNDHKKAIDQARANALFFGQPYRVFTDTNGNWHCERLEHDLQGADWIAYPDGQVVAVNRPSPPPMINRTDKE